MTNGPNKVPHIHSQMDMYVQRGIYVVLLNLYIFWTFEFGCCCWYFFRLLLWTVFVVASAVNNGPEQKKRTELTIIHKI